MTETTATEAADCEASRRIKGAMRVGLLSKGVLLRDDLTEHLVIICSEKPTRSLLQRIVDHLPAQLEVRSSYAHRSSHAHHNWSAVLQYFSSSSSPESCCFHDFANHHGPELVCRLCVTQNSVGIDPPGATFRVCVCLGRPTSFFRLLERPESRARSTTKWSDLLLHHAKYQNIWSLVVLIILEMCRLCIIHLGFYTEH